METEPELELGLCVWLNFDHTEEMRSLVADCEASRDRQLELGTADAAEAYRMLVEAVGNGLQVFIHQLCPTAILKEHFAAIMSAGIDGLDYDFMASNMIGQMESHKRGEKVLREQIRRQLMGEPLAVE